MSERPLSGQVAVVTGGSGGIGSAIVRLLTAAGAHAESFDITRPAGAELSWTHCDVREDQSVSAAVNDVLRRHHRIDIAVHAAGVSRDAVLWKTSVADWDLVQSVNLRGAFLLLRHTAHVLRERGGSVVLIGSINGSRGKFGTAAYSASKAGLLGLGRTTAREMARFEVRVNVIEPGWVSTPLTDAVPEAVRNAAVQESLLKEVLDPEDIANAVVYLCGPGGRRITGQVLRVDAGQIVGG